MTDIAPALSLRLVVAFGLAAAAVLPARAEGNRLLPFWGQPYPAGYAWPRAAPEARAATPCRRDRLRGAARYGERCDGVLHARD